jgi:hypothetical protein
MTDTTLEAVKAAIRPSIIDATGGGAMGLAQYEIDEIVDDAAQAALDAIFGNMRIEELEDENNRLRDQCGGALRYAYRIRDQHPDLHGLVEHNVLGIIDVLEAALEAPPDEDEEPPTFAKDPFNNDGAARCGDCGGWMTVVRPGKVQCDNPDCGSNANG